MAKQTPVLTKTFVADADTGANLCVVMSGTNAGQVALPGAADAMKFVGVTEEASSGTKKTVPVTVSGVVQVTIDGSGAITAGDYLAIAGTSGKVKNAGAPAFGGATTKGIVGIALQSAAATDGLKVDMLIMPFLHRP